MCVFLLYKLEYSRKRYRFRRLYFYAVQDVISVDTEWIMLLRESLKQ